MRSPVPFLTIHTPFKQDGSLDFPALRNSVEFDISAGSKTLLLTYGGSLYSLLTDDEVAEVAKVVAEQAAGRAMVVAADRAWATPKEVEFARYAREIGADVLIVIPPDWAASCTVQTMVEHYGSVAQEIPVMVVTGVFAARSAAFGLEVLERLMASVPGVVAVKDDLCGEFAHRLCLLAHGHLAIFAGGEKGNHLNMYPYGCDGYLSTFITFKPEVAHRYWHAIEAGDLTAAREVIRTYEMPFFDHIVRLRGGFNAGVQGTLELFGVAGRWRRRPYYSLNDEEMEELAEFFRNLSLL